MSKHATRTYSRYSKDAVGLLGRLIKASRKERGLTAQQLADRAGISRSMLQRMEKGSLKCEIGAMFEVATIVGLQLFEAEAGTLARRIHQVDDKLTLLPKSVRRKTKVVDDDF